jgi:2,4-dienoyl-CoA reductase-like NADH-dependent reductase (Old Yellow Enzyme family)
MARWREPAGHRQFWGGSPSCRMSISSRTLSVSDVWKHAPGASTSTASPRGYPAPMTSPRDLHAPFSFPRGRSAPNRAVLAAMTNKQSRADGTLGEDELTWLAARARGGFGVVTTCAMHVTPDGQGWDGELGAFGDEHLPGLTRVADSLRAEGALSLAQLVHTGSRAPSRLTGQQPWSASAFTLDEPRFEAPRAATEDDLRRTVDAFGAAAARCAAAGFDGVELHAAHGYLLCQFLGTVTNTRDDAWGGSPERRMRLLREVFAAARASTPDDFLIGVRLSPEVPAQGLAVEASLAVARQLVADGVDFVHASLWDSFAQPETLPELDVPHTTLWRRTLGAEVPLIVTGGLWTPAQAATILDQGADLVGLARAGIAHADWPRRAQDPDWDPERPPYAAQRLRDAALGPRFVDYMRLWPDFVLDEG